MMGQRAGTSVSIMRMNSLLLWRRRDAQRLQMSRSHDRASRSSPELVSRCSI